MPISANMFMRSSSRARSTHMPAHVHTHACALVYARSEELHEGFSVHIPELDEANSQYLCEHFDRDGGGFVDFDEMCETIDEYQKSKEAPATPSKDETQTDGEMLVTTYSGSDSALIAVVCPRRMFVLDAGYISTVALLCLSLIPSTFKV